MKIQIAPVLAGAANAPFFNLVEGSDASEQLTGTTGRDLVVGHDGDDVLIGDAGFDILLAGGGDDRLVGGAGFDLLVGGNGGDVYEVSIADGGLDMVYDNGNAPNLNGYYSSGLDELLLTGFESFDAAIHAISLEISGDDLILTYSTGATTGQVAIVDHFAGPGFALEQIAFDDSLPFHVLALSGDLFTYSVDNGADQGGEDLVLGTNAGEAIYGGIGVDILFGGGGGDNFIFHDEEESNGPRDYILDFELGIDRIDMSDIKDLAFSDLSVVDNEWGNAVVTTAYGSIELIGISALDVTSDVFVFA